MSYDFDQQLNFSGITNIMQLIAVCSALWSLDTVGRKPPLLLGVIGIMICHMISAIMIGLYANDWPNHPNEAKVGVAMLMLFMIFALGAPVRDPLDPSTRAKGVALSVASNWLNNFIIGLITPPLIQASPWGTFVFFAGWSGISVLFVWFFVPETKNRSLEDMDILFHTNVAVHDAREKALILGKLTGRDTVDILARRLDNKQENKGQEKRFEYV